MAARRPTAPSAIALDIETCPLPQETLSEAQTDRLSSEMDYRRRRSDGELAGAELEEEKRLARSTHPILGWVCCVSLIRQAGRETSDPISFLAASPGEEASLLGELWDYIGRQVPRTVTWVTFNGKDFDVPFLQMRSLARGIEPAESGLNDTYPYSNEPHADLMKLWTSQHYTLGQLCSHLRVSSPKGAVDGSDVATLVERGKLDAVASYCEGDARATLECWQAARPLLKRLN